MSGARDRRWAAWANASKGFERIAMKTSTKAAAAERRRRPPPRCVRRPQVAASRQRGGRRPQPPPQAAVHAFFREGCVNVKYSGATRARSLCFIRRRELEKRVLPCGRRTFENGMLRATDYDPQEMPYCKVNSFAGERSCRPT